MIINKDKNNMDKTYLAQKEKQIVTEANEIIDLDLAKELGEQNQKYIIKLENERAKIIDKMTILEDYYKVFDACKDNKYKTVKAEETVDKQIYN